MSFAGGYHKATPWTAVALWAHLLLQNKAHWGFRSGIFGFVGFFNIFFPVCLVRH